jgi:hypothetical protein
VDFQHIAEFITDDAQERSHAVPPRDAIVALLDLAFHASLAREEGVPVRCDFLLIDPARPDPKPPPKITELRWRCIPLTERVRLTVAHIAKLASAADPWATSVAVSLDEDGWFAWALVDQQIHYNRWRYLDAEFGSANPQTYRVSIVDVGHIEISWDYESLVRVIRDQVLTAPEPVFLFGPVNSRLREIIEPFTTEVVAQVGSEEFNRLPVWPGSIRREITNAIQRILLNIVRYRHGGALIITSCDDADLKPKYTLAYDRLGKAILKQIVATIRWREASDKLHIENPISVETYSRSHRSNWNRIETAHEISGCVQTIASLARVDGLVWLSDSLEVRGFGVEIHTKRDPDVLIACEDAEASEGRREQRDPSTYGMRHRSMMRYCFAHQGALGFVVSQDGPVRAMLRASDTLLFWEDIGLRYE